MSTLTMRSTHAASPSYVPRTFSRPASPSLGQSLTPKLGETERRGSHLKNEVNEKGSEDAKAILKMLANLPAPLPESLPPNFLPTPTPSPQSTSSPSPTKTFPQFVRSHPKKRRRSSSLSSSDGDVKPAALGLALGLSISMSEPEVHKKRKVSPTSPELQRSVTPMGTGSPVLGPVRREHGRSGLRNEISDGEGDKLGWSKDRWREAGQAYRARALLLKRHGDAHQRSPSAQPQFASLPHDPLKGLLCLTDAVLLWLYAYFCEEQAGGRVRSSPYNESAPLRDFVRKGWEGDMRCAKEEDGRETARAMVGLMHLIEAVICYHLTAEQLAHLHRRGKELSVAASTGPSTHDPSPSSTTSASPPVITGPSPSSTHSNPSPESNTSYHLPTDLLPLISSSTTSSTRATTHLLTSRHHLPLRLLRSRFPQTFGHAINSELSDEALPAPGDGLGAARKVDVDEPERFSWPIELGMVCPVAHTVAFGRCLVGEVGGGLGTGWVVKLES